MKYFYQEKCTDWQDMSVKLRNEEFRLHWLFRGESLKNKYDVETSLQTSISRVCKDFKLELKYPPDVEREMMRDFRRKYDGADRQDVENDTLYCMSLMRHYGAPSRLLDWTYSPFVAAYFALEKWHPKYKPVVVVWCLSDEWCFESLKTAHPELQDDLVKYREVHEEKDTNPTIRERKNNLFEKLFMNDNYGFVYPVNPFHFHIRPNVQQGVFLCPGKVSVPVVDILMQQDGFDMRTSMRMFYWEINDEKECLRALDELHRSNISRVSLFPGPDGFAYSLNYRLYHYDLLAEWRKSERLKKAKIDSV